MIRLADHSIGSDHPPFIIAEMSGNHNQSLDRALEIVDAAADAGAHAIKLQTYTADTMTINLSSGAFIIDEPTSLWYGCNLYELYQRAHTPWDWHKPIFERAKRRGIICFSSAFDSTAVDFLEELGTPCYKVASFENTDLPLIQRVAATAKPVIVSTGMATLAEIDAIVTTAREAGCKDLIILKCTSSYPASAADSNLNAIPVLRQTFGVEVGLSDHTLGNSVAIASVALGVTVIEKHFTLSRSDGGVDSAFSMEPAELKDLVESTERVRRSLGQPMFGPTEAEKKSLRFRRSLYVVEDIAAGQIITETNVRAIRPGFGLPPKYLAQLIGTRVEKAATRGTPVTWDLFK
jgi:pseudaminic acid synthase